MNSAASAEHNIIPAWLLGALGAFLLRLLSASWRVEFQGLEQLNSFHADGKRILIVCWHGGYIPLFGLLRQHQATVLVSDSFRGRVIQEICRRFGHRGIVVPDTPQTPTKIPYQAAQTCYSMGLAVDGPLGPFHVVKTGAVRLASDLGYAVFPAAAAGHHSWRFTKRWDRMEIPCLFTHVALVIGPPIWIPSHLDRSRLQPWQERIGSALHKAEYEAKLRVRHVK